MTALANTNDATHEVLALEALFTPSGLRRLRILISAIECPTSPVQTSRLEDRPVSQVAYHFGVLEQAGLLEVVDEIPRRGATEHIYGATPMGAQALAALGPLTGELAAIADDLEPKALDLVNGSAQCVRCGCTENRACEDGCGWAMANPWVCTACAEQSTDGGEGP